MMFISDVICILDTSRSFSIVPQDKFDHMKDALKRKYNLEM